MFSLQSNNKLKVHFAGAEQLVHTAALKTAGIHYSLFTVLPCICKKIGLSSVLMAEKAMKVSMRDIPAVCDSAFSHVIMDSGIYGLLYGQHRGKFDKKLLHKWYDLYCDFISVFVPKRVTVVEVDCQSALSTSIAWEMRKRMMDDCPNHEQINVWHLEDGRAGLDEMIEFSSYIGLSVPEFRRRMCGNRIGGNEYKKFVLSMVRYIKRKKQRIKIHLLGCTCKEILKECASLVDSVDSTGWLCMSIYGGQNRIEKSIARYNDDKSLIYKECMSNLQQLYDLDKMSKGLKIDCARKAFASAYWKKKYSAYCGEQ